MPTPVLHAPSTSTVATPRTDVEDAARDSLLGRYEAATGLRLRPTSVRLASGAHVLVDGASSDGSVFVEVHEDTGTCPHLDLAVAAQKVFTLALVRAAHPDARTVVLVRTEAIRRVLSARVAGTPAGTSVDIVCP